MVRVFNHWINANTLLRAFVDLILLLVFVMAAVAVVGGVESRSGHPVLTTHGFFFAVAFAVSMLLVNSWLGFYQEKTNRIWSWTSGMKVLSLYVAVPIGIMLLALLPNVGGQSERLLAASLFALVGVDFIGSFLRQQDAKPAFVHRILVVGAGQEAARAAEAIRNIAGEIEIVGFHRVERDDAICVAADQLRGEGATLLDTVRSCRANSVIVAVGERRGGVMPLHELLDCKLAGVNVLDLATFFERSVGQLRLGSIRPSWLVFGEGFRQGWFRTAIKRLFDVTAASILLALFLPVMLITALLILLEGGFPILYRQERVGLHGRAFNVIKFRSMRTDAESDGNPRWAAENDDRVTRVGRVIRKLRIDELPQLLSVLRGDMSLVGPRPERPYFVEQLKREIPYYDARHSVKPGVSGWAQVRYPYGASVEDAREKLQYDLYYVKNHSLFLDLVVLFETVGVVIKGSGAH